MLSELADQWDYPVRGVRAAREDDEPHQGAGAGGDAHRDQQIRLSPLLRAARVAQERVAAVRDREPPGALRAARVDVPAPPFPPSVMTDPSRAVPGPRFGLSRPVWLLGWGGFFTATASARGYPRLPPFFLPG